MHAVAHNDDVSRRRNSRPRNPLLSQRAVETARIALAASGETGPGEIGEHLGVSGLSSTSATHRFAADVPGYPDWEWNVVLACANGSHDVTISELALVPAPTGGALQAPEWVPYSDRLRPGDLGPGDLMPPAPDDERLTREAEDPQAITVDAPGERTNFLTARGLDAAKQRWRTGDHGPTSEYAEKTQMRCATCAFYVPFGRPVGRDFGACVNEYSADGYVVHSSYGCGAHSQTSIAHESARGGEAVFDDERPIF